jgi:hypothetical protein
VTEVPKAIERLAKEEQWREQALNDAAGTPDSPRRESRPRVRLNRASRIELHRAAA